MGELGLVQETANFVKGRRRCNGKNKAAIKWYVAKAAKERPNERTLGLVQDETRVRQGIVVKKTVPTSLTHIGWLRLWRSRKNIRGSSDCVLPPVVYAGIACFVALCASLSILKYFMVRFVIHFVSLLLQNEYKRRILFILPLNEINLNISLQNG